MKTLKIYLDTSVINFLFADDAPEKKEITLEFFNNFVSPQLYDVYVSNVVTAEIEATKDIEKKNKLLSVFDEYPIKFVSIQTSDEIDELVTQYINNKVIPENKIADASHIAISVINQMDILLSWNFRHLANINKERKVNIINLQNNYHQLRIITPMEVIDYEKL